jgi:nondiscriminating glutamyl-tRNA synthetase
VPDLTALAAPFLTQKGLPSSGPIVEGAIALEREKAKLLTEIPGLIDFLITDELDYREEAFTKVLKAPGAKEILEELAKRLVALNPFDIAGIEALCKTLAKDRGVKNGAIFHPLRVAVSGRTEGPSLWHMVDYLGKERTLARIKKAQERL